METQDRLSILFVGGHPHDAIAQAGGTLALHAKRGDKVTAAVLTHGGHTHTIKYIDETVYGTEELTDEGLTEAARTMRNEIHDACRVLGFDDVRFLETTDDIVLVERSTIRAVENVIRDVQPDLIITHHPLAEAGIGFTHATTGQIVMHASVAAASIRPDHPLPAWRVAQVFFITPPQFISSLDSQIPRLAQVFVDVRDVIHLKVEAERQVKSQYRDQSAIKKHECTAGYWGIMVRVPYSEAFTPYYPDVHKHLYVSEHRRREVRSSHNETLQDYTQMLLQS